MTALVGELIETEHGLSARQEAFCVEFVKTRNRVASYRAAFECAHYSYPTIAVRASELYRDPLIRRRIYELIMEAAAPAMMSVGRVVERLALIAFADPNELIAMKIGACRYCHGEGHKYHWRLAEYEEAMTETERANAALIARGKPATTPYPDPGGGLDYDHTAEPHASCPNCKGEGLPRVVARDTETLSPAGRALYAGVEQTNNGLKVRMADQDKALDLLARILGAYKDDAPRKLQVEVKAITDAVEMETKDPAKAAKMYQDMLKTRMGA